MATILTHPNGHPYDSGIITTDENNIVTKWLHKEDERTIYKNRVNAGIHILSPEIFHMFGELPEKKDLDRDILQALIPLKKLAAYDSPECIKDMGTPEHYELVANDIASFRNGKKLLVAGNGGSAADAEHIVGELMKGFVKKRPLDEKMLLKLKEVDELEGCYIGEKLQRVLPAIMYPLGLMVSALFQGWILFTPFLLYNCS